MIQRDVKRSSPAPDEAAVYRLAVAGGELRASDHPDGKARVEFERDGKLLLSWTAPAVEPLVPPQPPVPPPAPVQPVLLVPERSGPDTSEDGRLLYVEEVAERLRLSRTTVYRMAAEGKLPSIRIGFSRRFRERDIAAWLERSKHGPGAAGEAPL